MTKRNVASEEQYILMPLRGVRATRASESLLSSLTSAGERAIAKKGALCLKVLDSIHDDGPKLVQMTRASLLAFKAEYAGLRVVPLRYYHPMVMGKIALSQSLRTSTFKTSRGLAVSVVSGTSGRPIPGCTVIAFTDFANRVGAQATTNKHGIASLKLPGSVQKLDALYVDPAMDYWSVFRRNVKVSVAALTLTLKLKPVLGYVDALAHFRGPADGSDGRGINVGVVDTGVASHPDLVIAGGRNTVVGESAAEYGDNGLGHGTHVAGIIAARGVPPAGVRGLAPGVALHSYRVFGRDQEGASNYSIAKAIDAAVADGCHLINMSLGGGPSDDLTREAIADARSRGSVVLAANGNDARQPVSWPARDSRALAVSAFGRVGTFPSDSPQKLEVARPYGVDRKNFVAAFSNIGPETDLTGPGVGIISTVPGGHAAWNGTSMATPAVCGRVAVLWSRDAKLMGMPADAERSAAVMARVLASGIPMGFGADFEGNGRL